MYTPPFVRKLNAHNYDFMALLKKQDGIYTQAVPDNGLPLDEQVYNDLDSYCSQNTITMCFLAS